MKQHDSKIRKGILMFSVCKWTFLIDVGDFDVGDLVEVGWTKWAKCKHDVNSQAETPLIFNAS